MKRLFELLKKAGNCLLALVKRFQFFLSLLAVVMLAKVAPTVALWLLITVLVLFCLRVLILLACVVFIGLALLISLFIN